MAPLFSLKAIWIVIPKAVNLLSRLSLHAASHGQGAPQAQVHRQTLQEDVLPQRVDWQVQEVEGGGAQWQQLWRLRQVIHCLKRRMEFTFYREFDMCVLNCMCIVTNIGLCVVFFFNVRVCKVSPVIKRTASLLSGPLPPSGRRKRRAGRSSMERSAPCLSVY